MPPAGQTRPASKSQIPRVAVFKQPVLRFIRWCHDSTVSLLSHRKNGRRRRRAPNKKVPAGTILLGRDSRPRWLLKGQRKVTFSIKIFGSATSFGRPRRHGRRSRRGRPYNFFIGSGRPPPPPWSAGRRHHNHGRRRHRHARPAAAATTMVGRPPSPQPRPPPPPCSAGRHRHRHHGRPDPIKNLYGRPWRQWRPKEGRRRKIYD